MISAEKAAGILEKARGLRSKGKSPEEVLAWLRKKLPGPDELPKVSNAGLARFLLDAGREAEALEIGLAILDTRETGDLAVEVREWISENLRSFRDRAVALDACWVHHGRAGDWDGGRRLVKLAAREVPEAIAGLRSRAVSRCEEASTAPFGHAALAHIALSDGSLPDTIFRLRSCLHGPRTLIQHAAMALKRLREKKPENPELGWALLETGHLTGDDWIDEAVELSSGDPERMTDYIRESMERSTASTRPGLAKLALELTRRHPGLAAAWEALADLQEDDPRGEVASRSEVAKLVPGSGPARDAMRRIEEIAEKHPRELDIAFGRIRALLYLPDLRRARKSLESRAGVDPTRTLSLITEARGAGVPLPDEYLIVEASCNHLLGRDPAAADRIRSAAGVPAAQRADALFRMRADSPDSPDLACALAEVYLLGDGFTRAETLLVGLIEQAPAAAPAVLKWLESDAARPLLAAGGASAVRARAELACGLEEEALTRIAKMCADGDPRGEVLLNLATTERIDATPAGDLDLEVLRLLVDSGQNPRLALSLVRRLREEGAGERVAEVLASRIPSDQSTEEEWIHTLGALYAELGRTAEAVSTARRAGTPSLALGALSRLTDRVPDEERWMVLESAADVLLQTDADAMKVLDVLEKILGAHPDRTDAVLDLIRRTPDSEGSRARRLLLRGRCEAALGRPGEAVGTLLDAAEAAAEREQAPTLARCAEEIGTIIEAHPDDDAARVALSRVGRLRGAADETLAPVLDAPDRTPALFARLDEIGDEFPEVHDALWTSVEWHRASGSFTEAAARLAKLLEAAPGEKDRVREVADALFDQSGAVAALRIAADVDRQNGDPAREAATCHRLFLADPETGEEVGERLAAIRDLHPGAEAALLTAVEVAVSRGALADLIEVGGKALASKMEGEGAAECAGSFARGGSLPGSAESVPFWMTLADLRASAGDPAGSVEALARVAAIEDPAEHTVVPRLLAMREDGVLPVEGLDLLVECRARDREPDLLATAIRWRIEVGDVDGPLRRSLREAAASLAEAGDDAPDLRSVLEDFSIEDGDGEGALGHLLAASDGLGAGDLSARLDRIGRGFPTMAEVPLEAALRVHAPAGRARDAALAVERAFDLDADLGLARGLPCIETMLADKGDEPDLLRVAARLMIRAGADEAALACLNRLEGSGEEYRPAALEMFGELAEACPGNLEVRIRWAEILAESAGAEGKAGGRWEDCVRRCREVLGKAPSAQDELRATKLLASALEGCESFEEAAAALRACREKHPDEPELPVLLRENHLAHMNLIYSRADSATVQVAALLRAGRAPEALGCLPGVETEEEGGEPDLDVVALRSRTHYACGHLDRVVSEAEELVAEFPATGRLDPRLREILYYKGRSLLRLGEEARGIRLLERLARDHPCHRACRSFLEEHYRRRDAGEEDPLTVTASLEEVRKHGQA